jgi:uncharacterized alpha-E superfamily protein
MSRLMLSRVADALYWMGRYLERAENLTRCLLVTEELSTEIRAFNEKLARDEWNELAIVFPGELEGTTDLEHLRGFFTAPRNPYSILFSLGRARENARAVREALSLEVFVTLNETYRALEARAGAGLGDYADIRDALAATHTGLMSIVGAVEHTLSRDQGWLFLKLGESLERVYRTAAVMRAKLPGLLTPPPDTDIPLYYTQWRSLLRSVSSLENYRKLHGARLEPHAVIEFLLFDPHAPRAIHFGVAAVKGYLEEISETRTVTAPGRIIGRLHARLSYHDGLPALPLLDEVQAELSRTHDAVDVLYFGT